MADDKTIARILGFETWAVVGLRANPARAAYGVARFLQQHGKRIMPVHPKAETVHGVEGVPALSDIDGPVDVVDVFVRSELAGGIVDEAVEIGAKAVWLQLGVIDHTAAQRARDAGLLVVMDRCPAIEWPRLGSRDSA